MCDAADLRDSRSSLREWGAIRSEKGSRRGFGPSAGPVPTGAATGAREVAADAQDSDLPDPRSASGAPRLVPDGRMRVLDPTTGTSPSADQAGAASDPAQPAQHRAGAASDPSAGRRAGTWVIRRVHPRSDATARAGRREDGFALHGTAAWVPLDIDHPSDPHHGQAARTGDGVVPCRWQRGGPIGLANDSSRRVDLPAPVSPARAIR